jgi:hypothetical protein
MSRTQIEERKKETYEQVMATTGEWTGCRRPLVMLKWLAAIWSILLPGQRNRMAIGGIVIAE